MCETLGFLDFLLQLFLEIFYFHFAGVVQVASVEPWGNETVD